MCSAFIHPRKATKKGYYCVVNYLIRQINFSTENTHFHRVSQSNTHTHVISNVWIKRTTYWVELLFKKISYGI